MTAPPASLPRRGRLAHRVMVIAVYAAALGLGHRLGDRDLFPFRASEASSSSPSSAARMLVARTRVGWVLGQPDLQAPPEAWAALRADAAAVRDSWPPSLRRVFELLAAVRGLTTGGKPDWSQAESLCRALQWTRCDRASLQQLRTRGRP